MNRYALLAALPLLGLVASAAAAPLFSIACACGLCWHAASAPSGSAAAIRINFFMPHSFRWSRPSCRIEANERAGRRAVPSPALGRDWPQFFGCVGGEGE